MLENIYVWTFDEILCGWVLRRTDFLKETKGEYNFFRVMRDGTKNFYFNETDHFYHLSSMMPVTEKNIKVWTFDDNKWSKVKTDLVKNTGDESLLYKFNNGNSCNYYYSYNDFINHQRHIGAL